MNQLAASRSEAPFGSRGRSYVAIGVASAPDVRARAQFGILPYSNCETLHDLTQESSTASILMVTSGLEWSITPDLQLVFDPANNRGDDVAMSCRESACS